MSITCQLSGRILVKRHQPRGARGMPTERFERITGFKSEQNSSPSQLSEPEYSDLTYLWGTNQRTQFRDHRSRLVRFSDKATVQRKLGGLQPHLPRYDEDFSRRPAVAYSVSQFQPVHASGHVDVREQQGNIRVRFQQGNRFVRIASLQGCEA